MGKGHAVSLLYQGIRFGSPQPIITSDVAVGRVCRPSSVMEDERALRYSWQFFNMSVSGC